MGASRNSMRSASLPVRWRRPPWDWLSNHGAFALALAVGLALNAHDGGIRLLGGHQGIEAEVLSFRKTEGPAPGFSFVQHNQTNRGGVV